MDGSGGTGAGAVVVGETGDATIISSSSGDGSSTSQAALGAQALQDYFGGHNVRVTLQTAASAAVQAPFLHDAILHSVACDDAPALATHLPLLWAAMKPRSVHVLTLARAATHAGCVPPPGASAALPPHTRLKCCPDRLGALCTQYPPTADVALEALFAHNHHMCFAWKDA